MSEKTCGDVRDNPADPDGENLVCNQSQGHTEPTTRLPQGSAHEDSTQVDALTGEPWRWW